MSDLIFWKESILDVNAEYSGGYFFRSFELNKAIEKLEKKAGEVVGFRIVGNNIEFIVNKTKGNNDATPT